MRDDVSCTSAAHGLAGRPPAVCFLRNVYEDSLQPRCSGCFHILKNMERVRGRTCVSLEDGYGEWVARQVHDD